MSKRIICSVLAAAMLLLGSCGKAETGLKPEDVTELRAATAAQSANISVNGATAAYFFNDHYEAFTSVMASKLEKDGFDENKPLGEQYYTEGESWLGYFTDSMRTYLAHYMALCESAEVNGISLDEAELAALESRAARGVKGKYGANLETGDILTAMKLEALANKLSSVKKAELMPDEETMREYAEENIDDYSYPESATVNVRHILFSVDTYGSAEAALAKANEVKAQMGEVTAKEFGLLALEYSDDPATCYIGGAYANLGSKETAAAFNSWCFDEARTAGEVAVIETEHGAHIMYFEGAGLPKWQADISEIMIDKDFTLICDLLYKTYPVTFNEETVAKIAK